MAKVVFMGTPEFAVPTLQKLIQFHDVTGVVTQPDRPAGRNNVMHSPPVKHLAEEYSIPVFQPEKLRAKSAIETLREWEADVYVVAAFGQILPQAVLDIPKYGSINVHASLLPRWRGAAPIQAAVRAGDSESGVTIMKMDAGLDTGPMLSKVVIPIFRDETGQSLHNRLSTLGADLLIPTLEGYMCGAIQPQQQDESLVTYAPQIEKEHGRIDWNVESLLIDRQVRAFTPWPGTFTHWDDKMLKIISGEARFTGSEEPGRVCEYYDRVAIGTGGGLYIPQVVQLAGKKPTMIEDFIRGYPEFMGALLS